MSPQSKKRVVRVLVSKMFLDVPHLIFLFTVCGDSIHCFELLARTTFATYVCIYVYIYIHTYLLVRVYTYMSLDPSGEGVKLISMIVLYKFGRHFPFPGGWAAFGLNFCYPLAL